MAGTTPIYGLPYPQSSDLVSAYPALGQDLAEDLDGILAAKAALASPALTGTPTVNGTAITALSGLVRIHTETFSAVSSIILNSKFSAIYDNYVLTIYGTVSEDSDPSVTVRLRASGTDATANYLNRRIYGAAAGSLAIDASPGTGAFWLTSADLSSQPAFYGSATFYRPFVAARTGYIADGFGGSSGGIFNFRTSAENTNETSYDGISILASAGNMTGVAILYGQAKA